MNPSTALRSAARAATRRPLTSALPRQHQLAATAVRALARRSASTNAEPITTPVPSLKKEVAYTADNYPDIKRGSNFSKLTPEDITYFESICPIVSTDKGASSDELEAFNTDWMRKYRGQTRLVVKPRSTADVSKILKYCSERGLAVVPQGGNTGLVGGSVPVFDEIIINMSSMNQVRSFDAVSGVIVCEAGVILEAADSYLREHGYIFPLDLGAKGSCHVGGNVATNAGGLRLLRYGSLHGSVLGVEAVLPDGRILDDLCVLRKNNTGYDLKQLFIGSEGTIGIITAISVVCPQKPASQNVAFFGVDSYEKVQQAFVKTKQQLSEILSAFEFMDENSQRMVGEVTGKKRPLESKAPFYVLIETSGSNAEHDSEVYFHVPPPYRALLTHCRNSMLSLKT